MTKIKLGGGFRMPAPVAEPSAVRQGGKRITPAHPRIRLGGGFRSPTVKLGGGFRLP